jgi:hypothetical protein
MQRRVANMVRANRGPDLKREDCSQPKLCSSDLNQRLHLNDVYVSGCCRDRVWTPARPAHLNSHSSANARRTTPEAELDYGR